MENKTIQEIEDEIVEEFELFDDWTDKYQYIIELGQKLKDFPKEEYKEENKIKGCQSSVWMIPSVNEGKIIFQADSDSTIVKGLAAILVRVLSGQRPHEIVNADLTFIERIGLGQHLAATRSNGLAAMVKQMKFYALGLESKL